MKLKLPRVSADKVVKLLKKLGFVCVRQSGSHQIYRNAEGKRVTVPRHSKKILHPKIIKSIIQDTDLTFEKFIELL
ncbi:MAG TPA: type II toxin-antitoxin system HicA family toxin [archaeon]|nr:type II toxin-antitoxin system HicA family toxin [archaeon]